MNKLYIGLMSGTAMDGIDASLIETDGRSYITPIDDLYIPYAQDLRDRIKALSSNITLGFLELEQALTKLNLAIILDLLKKTGVKNHEIEAIGFHGQAIYHNPDQGINWQLGNPFLLAAKTGIKIVYDFRKRDIAYGGNGAPLIPVFHRALMQTQVKPLAVLNIGGVANITYIDEQTLVAFDPGPGNALIDDACSEYFGVPYDKNGEIARDGKPNLPAISRILTNYSYFQKPYPKSLDRDEFKAITESLFEENKVNIVSSLTHFTAMAIIHGLKRLPKIPQKLYLCGGGSYNNYLVQLITQLVTEKISGKCLVANIDQANNLKPNFIESQGFAYLAARCCNNLPSAFPSTTGADKENICGVVVYP